MTIRPAAKDARGAETSFLVDWITVAPVSTGVAAAVAPGDATARRRTTATMAVTLRMCPFSFTCGSTHPDAESPLAQHDDLATGLDAALVGPPIPLPLPDRRTIRAAAYAHDRIVRTVYAHGRGMDASSYPQILTGAGQAASGGTTWGLTGHVSIVDQT